MKRNVDLLLAVIDAVIEGIITCDSTGHITGINDAITTMFGYSREDLIGQASTILIPDSYKSKHTDGIERLGRGEPPRIIGKLLDLEGVKKDGTIFPIALSLTISKVYDSVIYIAVIRDITDRQAKEKKIQQLNDMLSTRVEALEAFQYSVCHDLHAPLRSLEGFSEALVEDYGKWLDGTGVDYVNRIVAATKRMRNLINDMLRLSKVTRPGLELFKQKVCLSDLVTKIIADCQIVEPKRKIEIVVEQNLYVEADEEFIEIALNNLLNNAWKFTRNKDVTKIEFGRLTSTDEDVYYVRDNGAGFDMSKYDKLFQPFKRLHDKKDFEGNGIGLTIVKRIVELHEGKVWAEGKVGEGATFYFTMGKKNA